MIGKPSFRTLQTKVSALHIWIFHQFLRSSLQNRTPSFCCSPNTWEGFYLDEPLGEELVQVAKGIQSKRAGLVEGKTGGWQTRNSS